MEFTIEGYSLGVFLANLTVARGGSGLVAPTITDLFIAGVLTAELSWHYSGDQSIPQFQFEVQQRVDGGPWTHNTIANAYDSYLQTGVVYGFTEFRIRAFTDIEVGPWSNIRGIMFIGIDAPDGAYPGQPINVIGGNGPFTILLNGSPVFTGPLPLSIPLTAQEGDSISVRDVNNIISNAIVAEREPFVDPIAGLLNLKRLQTTDKYTMMPPRDCIIVSGAGSDQVNGRYYQTSPTRWYNPAKNVEIAKSTSWFFSWLSAGMWMYLSNQADLDSPIDVTDWSPLNDGEFPTPTLTLVSEPQNHKDCIDVVGAGISAANGRYYQLAYDSPYWVKPGGFAVGWNLGFGNSWYLTSGADILYQTAADFSGNPSSIEWTSTDPGYGNPPNVDRAEEPQYLPLGIAIADGAANALWSDVITATGIASQSNALSRPLTQREIGVPVLSLDGIDDWMNSGIASNVLNTRGTFFAVFRVNDGFTLNGNHVIGASSSGPSLSANGANSQWGLYKTAGWATRLPIATTPYKWVSFVATWENLNFKYHCVSEGVDELKINTIANAFSSARTEGIGIGLRYTNTGVALSFLSAKYIAVGIDDRFMSDADIEKLALYGQTLFPPS